MENLNNSNILLIYLCSLLFLGCESNNGSGFDPLLTRSLALKDSLSLHFSSADTLIIKDFILGDYTDHQTVEIAEVSYLIGINTASHGLDIINLTTRKSGKAIQFQSDGPDGISGNIDGFFYHNSDSIFVLSIDENSIHLMNDKAEKIDEYSFIELPLPDGFSNYDTYADQGLMNGPYYNAKDKTLQFYTYRWVDADNEGYDFKLFASFSITNRAFQSIYGIYPAHFQKGVNFSLYNDPSLLTIDRLSYVYFGTSSNIYGYDNHTGELLFVSDYHCEHWPGPPESLPQNTDFQQGQDWLTATAAYIYLLHDEKNELIYRLMKRKQAVTNSNGLLQPRWLGEWCVDIFDKNMHPVGHTEIPANQVMPAISFVSDGALWIKNPSNKNVEGESLFYKLKITKNE